MLKTKTRSNKNSEESITNGHEKQKKNNREMLKNLHQTPTQKNQTNEHEHSHHELQNRRKRNSFMHELEEEAEGITEETASDPEKEVDIQIQELFRTPSQRDQRTLFPMFSR